jgi:hypothetical protein
MEREPGTRGSDGAGVGKPRRHGLVWLLLGFLVLQGIGGIFGGVAFVLAPDGDLLRIPTSYLEGTPFSDFLIPGLLLLTVLGVFPLVVAVGLWRRRPWAWFGAFAVGCGLVIFELVEYAMIGQDPQQLVWGSIGGLIAVLCIAPSVQRYSGVWWGRIT